MSNCTSVFLEAKTFPGRSITNTGDNCMTAVSDLFGRGLDKSWGIQRQNQR